MKNSLKIGVMTLVVAALATGGVALALDDTPAGGDEIVPGARIAQALEPLVEDGTLTQEQADAVGETLAARHGEFRGRHGGGAHLEEVAEFLGLTAEEVRDALVAGSTLAEIAAENGSSGDALAAHLTEQARSQIDERRADMVARLEQAVSDGDLDQARADEILAGFEERSAGMEQRITDLVNGELPAGPGGFGGPGGPHDGGPHGGGPGSGHGGPFGSGPHGVFGAPTG